MAYLPCDNCGASTNHQGSWDTPIKILCEKCGDKINKDKYNKIPTFDLELNSSFEERNINNI